MFDVNPALRRRIVITLVLVVLLPFVFLYVFVTAVNWIILPTLEWLGYGPFYGRFYISPGVAVIVVFGGLLAQLWLGPRMVLSSIGARPVIDEEYPELINTVNRLAHQADLEPPNVAVASNSTPNAAAVRGPTGATIVVTTGLLDLLETDEREAVIAHELSHIKNRDATVLTVAWLLPTLTYYLALGSATAIYYLYRGMGRSGGGRGRGVAHALVVLTVTAIVTVAISALFWFASVLVHRLLSRYREYAADRGAVSLTGDPAALAGALTKLDERMPTVPDRDLRRLDGGAEALYVAPLEARAFSNAELVSTDIFPRTHPPTRERIARLRELAGDLE